MVINFNKKRRKIALVILIILCAIGVFFLINHKTENDTMQIVDDKQINNYIIDVVFNDKDEAKTKSLYQQIEDKLKK